jgi:hypothetical protein
VSNIDRTGRTSSGPPAVPARETTSAPAARTLPPPPIELASSELPSPAGTAVLNLTGEQIARIRILLVAMRLGKALAADVRSQIYEMLSGGQRRVIGAAYFILSVRA